MKLYHRTFFSAEILADGFKDGVGNYMTDLEWSGVWFSDVPFDAFEGYDGGAEDVLLTIEIPDEAITDYEWIEDGKPYREWLIPASIANQYGPPMVIG